MAEGRTIVLELVLVRECCKGERGGRPIGEGKKRGDDDNHL